MKRFFIVLAISCAVSIGAVDAQEMQKGSTLLNLGMGLGPGVGANISLDYGLIDEWGDGIFTLGGFVGIHSSHTYVGGVNYALIAFAPRATYRYTIDHRFEVYGVFSLGAFFYTGDHSGGGPFWGIAAGGRYNLPGNISLFTELGHNLSGLTLGLSFKL